MATETQPADSAGVLGFLKASVSAAGKRVSDMELDKKLAPLVDHGKEAAASGVKAVGEVGEQARELATQSKLWDEQHVLIEQVLEVLTLQQALIEDLRSRMTRIEGGV